MADVSLREIMMEIILRHFFDFQSLLSTELFGSGHIHTTFKVEVTRDGKPERFLVQRMNHGVFRHPAAVMQNIARVAHHLSGQHYPLQILSPLTTPSGDFLYQDKAGDFWRIFPFFDHTITFNKVETPDQAYEGARAFGIFAKALDNMDTTRLVPTIPAFHNGLKRLAYFREVLKRAIPGRLEQAKEQVASILQNQLIFHKIADLDLPLRVIHHDTKINNLLFDENSRKAACVIDLDTVMPGIILSDFGDMMRTFTSPADEDEADLSKVEMRMPFYEALLQGFMVEMQELLTPVERNNLSEGGRWLTLMQAVRFLTDFLEGDIYYKPNYPLHNLIRAKNQLALFHSMSVQLV